MEAPPITTRSALEEARDQAIRAALAAGNLIRAEAGRIGASAIRNKGIHDIVTPVDDAAQALILEQLETAFPDIGVLAEEDRPDVAASQTAHDGQACRWIVDPIDGTTNFAHGVPPYAVSIALECSGEIVVGVVYDVSRDELFTAIRGGGLRVNGRPAAVTVTGALDQSLVTTGFPYRSFSHAEPYTEVLKAFFERSRGVRRPGSASVDLAYVACGRFDGFFESGLAPWDVAAGTLLVREAGGRVTDFSDGSDVVFGRQILASNGQVHQEMLSILQPLRHIKD